VINNNNKNYYFFKKIHKNNRDKSYRLFNLNLIIIIDRDENGNDGDVGR